MLKERGWGIHSVKKHQDWSGKYCPHRTLDFRLAEILEYGTGISWRKAGSKQASSTAEAEQACKQ